MNDSDLKTNSFLIDIGKFNIERKLKIKESLKLFLICLALTPLAFILLFFLETRSMFINIIHKFGSTTLLLGAIAGLFLSVKEFILQLRLKCPREIMSEDYLFLPNFGEKIRISRIIKVNMNENNLVIDYITKNNKSIKTKMFSKSYLVNPNSIIENEIILKINEDGKFIKVEPQLKTDSVILFIFKKLFSIMLKLLVYFIGFVATFWPVILIIFLLIYFLK